MELKLLPLMVLIMPACLVVPAAVPDLEEDTANRPPRIIDNLAYPSPDETVVVLNNNCSSYVFNAYVSDPDHDALYYRVFVNYYLVSSPYMEGGISAATLDGKGQALLRFYLSNRDNGHFLAAANQGYSFDVVELVVSDRPFLDNDYRNTVPEGEQDRYVWTIIRRDLGPCTN